MTLYNFLYEWINLVLNQEFLLNIIIIKSYQDAPAPTGCSYIVIDAPTGRRKVGSPSAQEPNDKGARNLVNDYEYKIEISQVNGDGELLQLLVDSIDRQEIKDLWRKNNFVYYSQGEIIKIPRLSESKWKKEAMVELTIGTAVTTVEQSSIIEDIEVEGKVNEHKIEI